MRPPRQGSKGRSKLTAPGIGSQTPKPLTHRGRCAQNETRLAEWKPTEPCSNQVRKVDVKADTPPGENCPNDEASYGGDDATFSLLSFESHSFLPFFVSLSTHSLPICRFPTAAPCGVVRGPKSSHAKATSAFDEGTRSAVPLLPTDAPATEGRVLEATQGGEDNEMIKAKLPARSHTAMPSTRARTEQGVRGSLNQAREHALAQASGRVKETKPKVPRHVTRNVMHAPRDCRRPRALRHLAGRTSLVFHFSAPTVSAGVALQEATPPSV